MSGARTVASLRRRLLGWLLLPLLLLMGVNAWWGYQRAAQVANDAYDRSLYLAARTLAEELQWVEDRLKLDVLRGAGYLFENHTGSRLFYRVDSPEHGWLAGNPGLPVLAPSEDLGVQFFALVHFDDALYQNTPVRVARLVHVMEGLAGADRLVVITVAETRETRDRLVAQVWRDTLMGQGLLLLAVAVLMVVGIQRGMGPLEAFRQRLDERRDDDFSAIDPPDVPRELRPLIETLNGYLRRLGRLIDIRKRFLDNAAHQLRTPLTVLKTQLTLAQRSDNETQRKSLVEAAARTTDAAVQLTEQLLSLTRAEHARDMHPSETVEVVALARHALEERLLDAHERADDLGFETCVPQWVVPGVAMMLHEALANLIDNALKHGGPGVKVTLRVVPNGIEVEDNGPGIAPEHQDHVFERFYRAATAHKAQGSGLGLAIVREIASQHGASVSLQSPVAHGRGTCVRIQWPSLAHKP